MHPTQSNTLHDFKKNHCNYKHACVFRYVVSRGLEDEADLLALFVQELAGLVADARAGPGPAEEEEAANGGTLLVLPGYQVFVAI